MQKGKSLSAETMAEDSYRHGAAMKLIDEARVDGRDGHEEGQSSPLNDPVPRCCGIELLRHLHSCAGVEGTEDNVDNPMHVVQRQDVVDAVIRIPLPRGKQCRDLQDGMGWVDGG